MDHPEQHLHLIGLPSARAPLRRTWKMFAGHVRRKRPGCFRHDLLSDSKGSSLTEYTLLIGLVAIGVIVIVSAVGDTSILKWTALDGGVPQTNNGSGPSNPSNPSSNTPPAGSPAAADTNLTGDREVTATQKPEIPAVAC